MKTDSRSQSQGAAAPRPIDPSRAERPSPGVISSLPAPSPARSPALPAKSKGARPVHQGSNSQSTVAFRFNAPTAQSVQLVGDFTEWTKAPITLTQGADGTWETKVPLPEGRHGYRFLVDGQWQDDPNCAVRESNPFGTSNAIVEVGRA